MDNIEHFLQKVTGVDDDLKKLTKDTKKNLKLFKDLKNDIEDLRTEVNVLTKLTNLKINETQELKKILVETIESYL